MKPSSQRIRVGKDMSAMLADIRQAFRGLIKTPSFTLVAVSVLAIGIGANTAVFTLLNTLLLRPLPYPNAGPLVFVGRSFTEGFGNSVSIQKFNVWKKASSAVEHMAAYDFGGPGLNLRSSDLPELVKAIQVSAEYFQLFGATPAQGRTFSSEEDQPGGPKVAVISDGLWK